MPEGLSITLVTDGEWVVSFQSVLLDLYRILDISFGIDLETRFFKPPYNPSEDPRDRINKYRRHSSRFG